MFLTFSFSPFDYFLRTAVAISPDKKTVVVGCSDGVVYIKSRDDTEHTALTAKKPKPKPGTYGYFMRGGNEVVDELPV